MIPDKGPWKVYTSHDGKVVVGSEDFEHDVCLELTGDFPDAATKIEYAEWLCRRLAVPEERANVVVPRERLEQWDRWLDVRGRDVVNPPLLTDAIRNEIAELLATPSPQREPTK